MFYKIDISIGGIVVKLLHPYIHKDTKAETFDRTLNESLFINRRVNSEGQLLVKYHFEFLVVECDELDDIKLLASHIGNFNYIDYYEIPESFSGDGSTRIWTLRRPLASESYLPIIIVDGVTQTVTIAYFDVGSLAIDRVSSYPDGKTLIIKENPSKFTGKITGIDIWSYQAMSEVTVATFTQGVANVFTARDSEFIGDVSGGSRVHKVVDLNVEIDDFLGLYWGGGYIERTLSGEGFWSLTGDQTECVDATFTLYPGHTISLRATREIAASNIQVDKDTGSMLFGSIPTNVIDNIKVLYVPKFPVHIVSCEPEKKEAGLDIYKVICEEV